MFVYYVESCKRNFWKAKEKRIHIFVGFCVGITLLLGFLFVREALNGKRTLITKSQQDFFAHEIFEVTLVNNENDPFSHHEFLSRNLAHLVSFTKFATLSKKPANATAYGITPDGQFAANYSYLLDDLIATVNVNNFFFYQWGCREVNNAQVEFLLHETKHQATYQAITDGYKVAIEVAKADVDELISAKCGSSDSDHSQHNLDRCFLIKYRRVLQEAVMLNHLNHPSVVRVLGFCVQRINPSQRLDSKIASSPGVVLLKEAGLPVKMEQMKTLSWQERVQACYSLVSLAKFLASLPMGSVLLRGWEPESFIISSKNQDIKLNSFTQLPLVSEPSCLSSKSCTVDGMDLGVKCMEQECRGYNAKKNLLELTETFLLPLLQFGVPSHLTKEISGVLNKLKTHQYSSAHDLLQQLDKYMPKTDAEGKPLDAYNAKHDSSNKNPGVLSVNNFPDGSQVDSWEQHEHGVSINEVNPDKILVRAPEPAPVQMEKHKEPVTIEGFQKIENADFPGRYDYYCPYSKAEWGCVMSLQTPEDAVNFCVKDPKCKAFVTIPHLRKEGWIIAILKSDNSKPVDHAGTTVYVRPVDNAMPEPEVKEPEVKPVVKKEDCLGDLETTQYYVRETGEALLMKSCGWKDMKDKNWESIVAESKVEDAKSFKPARGKLAIGGQMNVRLTLNNVDRPALFLAKRGPEEFEISQLAVYQLDRMLGLYKTVPALERQLSAAELAEAGFPVDIGGNQFDKFRQLKQPDGSLRGVIVPTIPERVTTVHYISVPKLSGITNAVTPFSKKQWDDMEYLLLGFLAAIPVPSKGHQSVQGHLIHVKTDDAFQSDNNDYLSYLYNCQFPAHVIDTLRYASANRCDLKDQFRTWLWTSESPLIGQLLERNVARLLDLVEQCVTKFGKQVVLYNSRAQ